jgi:hypothetical protein
MSDISFALFFSASTTIVGFLVMTCMRRLRPAAAIGLVGSFLHLLAIIRWQLLHESFLVIDLFGVALTSISAVLLGMRAITQPKRSHA